MKKIVTISLLVFVLASAAWGKTISDFVPREILSYTEIKSWAKLR